MEKSNDITITRKQYIFIIVGSMIGTGILSLPRTTAKILGQDAWIAVILGAILPMLSIFLIFILYRKYPDMDFVSLTQYLAGKIIGKLLIMTVIVHSVMISGIVCRILIEVISLFLLPSTPKVLLVSLILATAAYLVVSDLRVLGRINELLFYLLPLTLLLALPFTLINADIHQLLPPLIYEFKDYLEATYTTSFAFSGFEVSLLIYYYVKKKEKMLKAGAASIFLTTIIYLYTVTTAILILGAGLAQRFIFPTITLLSTKEIPFIERVEFIYIILWTSIAFKPICNQYFFSVHLSMQLINLKSKKVLSIIMLPIIGAFALFPSDTFMAIKLADYLGQFTLFVGIGIPLLLLLLSLLPRKGVRQIAK